MADDSELDEDLQDLLDQLDEQEDFLLDEPEIPEEPDEPEDPAPTTDATVVAVVDKIVDKIVDPIIDTLSDGDALRPVDEVAEINDQRRFDSNEDGVDTDIIGTKVVEITNVANEEMQQYLMKMDEVAEEVLGACRSDRAEAQDVINMLKSQCDAAHNVNKSPQRMYIDGLVKAVEVKADINSNAIKVMEGVAKMISATKASTSTENTSMQISGAELDKILENQAPGDALD